MRFIKRISDRGTVTLPSDVREALELQDGDIVEFEIVEIVKRKPVEDVGEAREGKSQDAGSGKS
jgi:AbrB family looped-hinge helix DNA binding protein